MSASEHDADLAGTEPETGTDEADVVPGHKNPRRRGRRRVRKILIILSAMILVPTLLATGGIYTLSEKYLCDIDRVPNIFAPIPKPQRPDKPVTGAAERGITYLVAGEDTRSGAPMTGSQARSDKCGRTEALMLVHITGNRCTSCRSRDSWVPIPGNGHPDYAKINAAYAYGGPTLTVRTVEQLTDVRINHFAVIDFAGFKGLIDTLGGVTVTIPRDFYDDYRGRRWSSGPT